MRADLGAAHAREIAFGLVGAGAIGTLELFRVIDAARVEGTVQHVPTRSFVGMDDGAVADLHLGNRGAIAFARADKRQRAAIAFAHHDNDQTLAGLGFGQAAILPVFLFILRLDVPTEIGAVDFHGSRQLGTVVNRRSHSFPHLVGKDESSLVLARQVATQLQGRDTLGAVAEQGDGGEVIPDRQLARGEDGAARDAELLPAAGALPNPPSGVSVYLHTTAVRAVGLPVIVRPADRNERRMRFLVRQPQHGR